MNKNILALVVFLVVFGCVSFAGEGVVEIPLERVEAAFGGAVGGHPRLFLTDGELGGVRKKIAGSSELKLLYANILKEADEVIDEEPVKRIKKGRRLLGVSRKCLHRVMVLSFAWRFTGEDKYLKRGEQELLAAAGFSDWNPSHFLDVAEMTTALGVGYDWLYNGLGEKSREIIKAAIVTKGIEPSLIEARHNWWVRGNSNWNQVCNGGMVVGALAIMEDEPKLARRIVHRAVNSVQIAMGGYEPDGAYPEGPGYWVYGTSYNVVLLAALESVLGTEFGLSEKKGFAKSCDYYLHMTGPSGLYFNYPDSGRSGSLVPTVFWFAEKHKDASLMWNQHRYLEAGLASTKHRLIPLALAWGASGSKAPEDLTWMGRGKNPVAAFRSSWTDPDAVYLAIKGGSPSTHHAHMDVGSFVIEADGVRWAFDLGPESYHKIESLGMKLWGRKQDDERWTIFRYSNFSHNTLVVNDQLQQVTGMAPIIRYSKKKSFSNAVFDMTSVYAGQLKKAIRGAGLFADGRIVIQDELEAGDAAAKVRWAMVTAAEVDILSNRKAVLRENGKSLGFEIVSGADAKLAVYSAQPRADYDAPNPGKRMIGFEVKLAAAETQRLVVVMTPGERKRGAGEYIASALLSWSEAIK